MELLKAWDRLVYDKISRLQDVVLDGHTRRLVIAPFEGFDQFGMVLETEGQRLVGEGEIEERAELQPETFDHREQRRRFGGAIDDEAELHILSEKITDVTALRRRNGLLVDFLQLRNVFPAYP